MHVISNIQAVDTKLNSYLHNNGPQASIFAWYLALQISNVEHHHAKNEATVENKLPYASMNLPSAPKPSLYAKDTHFVEYYAQSHSLHLCEQPSLLVQLYNSLQPHSLHGRSQPQLIPDEVIQSSSIFAQSLAQPNGNESEVNTYAQHDSSVMNNEASVISEDSILPVSDFVEDIMQNVKNSDIFQSNIV